MNYQSVSLGICTIQKYLKELPIKKWQFDFIGTMEKNWINHHEIRRCKRNNIVLRQ